MRFYVLSFCIMLSFSAWAVDFPGSMPKTNEVMKLSATSFPTTKFDTTFTERVDEMYKGYAPYETIWDDNGNCISGCAYSGMSIDSEKKRLERAAEIIQQKINTYCANNPADCMPPPEPDAIKTSENNSFFSHTCSPANTAISSNQTIPRGEPLIGEPPISSRFQRARNINGIVQDHNGIDFAVSVGTPVFSPAGGMVESVFQDKTCGKGVILKHSDGFGTLYCHLSDNSIVKHGQTVVAGCIIARTGNTGYSTGPHLHYAIYLNKQFVNPDKFISR